MDARTSEHSNTSHGCICLVFVQNTLSIAYFDERSMYSTVRTGRQLISRGLASIAVSGTSLTMPNDGPSASMPGTAHGSKSGDLLSTSDGRSYRRHPRFWREDGTLVITHLDDAFKVNGALPQLQSPVLSSLSRGHALDIFETCPVIGIPDRLQVKSEDIEAVLSHVYDEKCVR